MATNAPHKLRVMLDAKVLFAGVGWPRFPYEVLQHAVTGDFQLVLTPFIIDEARRHITRLIPHSRERFEAVLDACDYEEVPTPSREELAQHIGLVRDALDIPVALAAMNAGVDCLISSDKDLTDPNEAVHQHLRILLPGAFLRQSMGWTSEALEAIRNRTWKDVGG